MRISLALAWLGLLAAAVGCRKTTTVADDQPPVEEVARTTSRAGALGLIPDGVNFLASADMKSLMESELFSREVDLLRSLDIGPLEPLARCGVDFGGLTYVLLAGDTNTESNFVAIVSSPDLGAHTLECLADKGPGSVRVERGRSVATDPETQAKVYAISPGVLAMAAPGLQEALEARLDGQGQTAIAGSMREAVEFTDLDADIAFALASDEDLARDTPGFLALAAEATVADGLAVEFVSIFESPELAERLAAAVDLSIWKTVADDIGVSATVVDSVRIDVRGSVATLRVHATEDEVRSITDVVGKALREDLPRRDSDQDPRAGTSQRQEELDAQFLKRRAARYRSMWSDGDRQREYHERCLSKFVPELDAGIRETYCLCVARDMSAHGSDAAEAVEDCGIALYPIILRSAGVKECEALHGERACSCWVEARETSAALYLRASHACLDQSTTVNSPAWFGPE